MDKKKIGFIFDIIFILLFLGLGVYFVVEMFLGGIIPIKYIFVLISILLLLTIFVVLSFKVKKSYMGIVRKVGLVLLSILLLVGSLFQLQLRSAFSNVSDGSTAIDRMYVITLKEKDVSIEDIDSIGYVDQASELMTYSLKEMSSYNLKHQGYDSLEDMLVGLDSKEVDACFISAQDQTFEQKLADSQYDEKYHVIHTIEMSIDKESESIKTDVVKDPFVVYLSGMDEMGKPDYNGLSDVNMLLMVDPLRHHVEMVSINRDTYVPNAKYNDAPDKLTHLGWDGVESGKKALEKIFGIEIDYTAKVTFESLIKIIDTLGGIDVDVQISFTEQNEDRSFASSDLIHLEKGYQHLNGSQALAYARHRKTAGWDVKGREQAQRDIIAATVKKLLSVEGALKVGDVLNVAASYVSTNMSMDSAKAFLMNAIDEGAKWTFSSSTVNSNYEYLFPCASYGSQDLYAVLLQQKDINHIHNLYTDMLREVNLYDFEFDLDNMEQYQSSFQLNKKVITVENYYRVVPTYFPSYVRQRF